VDSALESLRKIAARGMRLVLKPPSLRQHLLSLDLLVHGLTQACRLGPLGPRPLILADPFTATNEEINDAIARKYPAAYSVSVPLNFIGTLSRQWQRCPEFGLTMPIASLAVLAIDNEFDWHPAFQALGIDSLEFDRNRTFDRYLS
jgi:hypothetical protein